MRRADVIDAISPCSLCSRSAARGPSSSTAVPIRMIDIDGPHLDAVLAHVAHDLRGRVKTHRLRIEQRRGEHVGIAAFQPGRGIDQQRKTRGMAFRKTVFAETLDLAEAALGEIALITFRRHAIDHSPAKCADRAGALEGRHRAAQLVRLGRREAARHDGDLHRLFLKQRNAQGFLEHRLQFILVAMFRDGEGYGGSSPVVRSFSRRRKYGCTMSPWIGPGRTIATSMTRS